MTDLGGPRGGRNLPGTVSAPVARGRGCFVGAAAVVIALVLAGAVAILVGGGGSTSKSSPTTAPLVIGGPATTAATTPDAPVARTPVRSGITARCAPRAASGAVVATVAVTSSMTALGSFEVSVRFEDGSGHALAAGRGTALFVPPGGTKQITVQAAASGAAPPAQCVVADAVFLPVASSPPTST